ncbi:MAG TPA: hypothetical protein VL172_09600 [Kofleriaceae bacterium]|jgi:hypothetical protein|nr:hypothetical protein [Kofleriaceae bacterium]
MIYRDAATSADKERVLGHLDVAGWLLLQLETLPPGLARDANGPAWEAIWEQLDRGRMLADELGFDTDGFDKVRGKSFTTPASPGLARQAISALAAGMAVVEPAVEDHPSAAEPAIRHLTRRRLTLGICLLGAIFLVLGYLAMNHLVQHLLKFPDPPEHESSESINLC